MNDEEFRQWCINKAIESGPGERVKEVAQALFNFTIAFDPTGIKQVKSITQESVKLIDTIKK